MTPRATLLVLGVVALQLLFIASYVGALHDPEPKDVPFGVVAPRAAAQQAVTRLERLPGSPLDPRAVADEATARKQIMSAPPLSPSRVPSGSSASASRSCSW